MTKTTSQKIESVPEKIRRLGDHWADLYTTLPALCDYSTICTQLGFKNPKSAANTMNRAPDCPKKVRVGRTVLFSRSDLILWAARRDESAKRRGRPRSTAE